MLEHFGGDSLQLNAVLLTLQSASIATLSSLVLGIAAARLTNRSAKISPR